MTLAVLSDILSAVARGPWVVTSERSIAASCPHMTVCSGRIHCFFNRCWSPSSAFLMIPGRFLTLLLSCWSEGNAVVLALEGSHSVSLPFSPLGCASISFSIGFFEFFFIFFGGGCAILFYTGVYSSRPLIFTLFSLTIYGFIFIAYLYTHHLFV